MPAFIPPGQGITTTAPVGMVTTPSAIQAGPTSNAPPRQQAPPSPFRQAHGPDLVLMPHQDDQPQPQQPQQQPPQQQPPQPVQMSMLGRTRQLLARRA